MTTMTKSDRTAAIAAILKETFAPRFELLTQQLTAAVEKNLNEQHPKFVQMLADREMRKYLSYYPSGDVYDSNPDYRSRFYSEPSYTYVAEHTLGTIPKRGETGFTAIAVPVEYCSHSMGEIFYVPAFESAHAALWDELLRAASKLRETFYAYKSREAFAKDFPKLAAYLPPAKVVVSTSTAVRLNPVDVMKDLASLGIPPETEEILCA